MKIRWAVVVYLSAMIFMALTIVLPPLIGVRTLKPDLSVMWTALRADNPYDIAEVTALHRPLWDMMPGPRAFGYPPSSLPLFFPFALLPFWTAYATWTALSVAFFYSAARRITKHAALSFLSPNVLITITLGQTALFTGGAAIWGIALLRSRPWLAGVIFGIGAALKPQCFILVPVALLSCRNRKAFAGMLLALSMFALPTLGYWLDWLAVARQFQPIIATYFPVVGMVGASPNYFAQAIDAPTLPFQIAGMVLGVAVVWFAFKSEDNRIRVIGLIAGTLLASFYAIRYELAGLSPALIDFVMLNTWRGAIIALPLLAVSVFTIVPTLVISLLGNASAFRWKGKAASS